MMLADFLTKPLQGVLFACFCAVILGHAPATSLLTPVSSGPSPERVEKWVDPSAPVSKQDKSGPQPVTSYVTLTTLTKGFLFSRKLAHILLQQSKQVHRQFTCIDPVFWFSGFSEFNAPRTTSLFC